MHQTSLIPQFLIDNRRVVAVFDVDGTLTTSDSLLAFLRIHHGNIGFVKILFQCSLQLALYALGAISNHQAKSTLLRSAFKGQQYSSLQKSANGLIQHWWPRHQNAWTFQKLKEHQAAGHTCLLLSASLDIYLQPLAQELAVQDLICTELAWQEEVCLGDWKTANCQGPEKLRRLESWLYEKQLKRENLAIYAYGDSSGDIPLLDWADKAWLKGKIYK